MQKKFKKLVSILGERKTLQDEPLGKYTSFHIGGPADLFFKALTQEELIKAVVSAEKLKIPFLIIGGGTNLLVGDLGFRGLVIKNETSTIRLIGVRGGKNFSDKNTLTKVNLVFLEVESGVSVNRLVRFTLDQGFCGLEAFLGQPGTVGGAVWINAHNMKERKFFGDMIYGAKVVDKKGKVRKVEKSYFKFGYDRSILQRTDKIVLSVVLKLQMDDKKSLWQRAQKAMEYRKKTQPQGVFSSGCVFRNISKSDALRIATPNYTQSAGYLIERVGLKGVKVGNTKFSTTHANFIVHKGGVKASDVIKLMNLAKRKVWEKFSVNLSEEIVLAGEF